MSKAYLLLYNLASAAGWGYVNHLAVTSYLDGKAPSEFWDVVNFPLKVVQTLAVLEVFHSLFGLVRSPVLSTLLQVTSRVAVLWGATNASVASQMHWSLYLMVLSWALVEVPRYLFYAVNLVMSKVPLPLFFLRYNLFMVLYPTGITGEILQILKALPFYKANFVPLWYVWIFGLFTYLPGGPFMYFHMLHQRKTSTAKRNEVPRPAPIPNGIEYPVDKKGERSTTAINQGAFAAAAEAVDRKAAEEVRAVKNWRFGYAKHVVRNVELSVQSPEACLKIAEAGLNYLHDNFEFIRDGKTMKLSEAMRTFTGTFETGTVKGTKPKPAKFEYSVPYKGKELKGEELLAQLDKWAKYGTIEPEARDAIAAVVKNQTWMDLSDQYFVLLGAGSAMGPLQVLLSLGANVIAVDLDRPAIWKRLIGLAKESSGTMVFPLKKPAAGLTEEQIYENAGSNLFTHTPEIKNWLTTVLPGKRLIIGGYAYLDGALFIKVSIAMDAVIKGVLEKRPNCALGFLCSPTDVFVIPDAAREDAIKNLRQAPLWQKAVSALSGGRFLVPNARKPVTGADGKQYSIVDGLVIPQGPNYALAKRLQHWRCMLARSAGCVVSTNIAPSTATVSVVHNKQFAAAYGGMHLFKPMEVFYQETSNAVMGALLIHDIRNPNSVANPSYKLNNPQELFSVGSFHGGVWRIGYKMNSIGETAAVAYYLGVYKGYLAGVFAALAAGVSYIVVNGPPHTW